MCLDNIYWLYNINEQWTILLVKTVNDIITYNFIEQMNLEHNYSYYTLLINKLILLVC